MSTFFATFDNLNSVTNLLQELLRSGVRPDDISVVTRTTPDGVAGDQMIEEHVTVGDATAIVGREDDPDLGPGIPPRNKNITDLTAAHEGNIGQIDTSDKRTNVDSVDQSDDSQSLAEDSLEPPRMTSNSEHEVDDLALTLKTGFPTPVPLQDDVRDADGPRQEQLSDSLERIIIPGKGYVLGGGALATAAFDVINPEHPAEASQLIRFFTDEGVPTDCANTFVQAFEDGKVVLAVGVNPAGVSEERIEAAAERWGGSNPGLFDAPRFHESGGYAS